MVEQDIAIADQAEDVFLVGNIGELGRGRGQKRHIVQVRPVQAVQAHQALEGERPRRAVNFARPDSQVVHEDLESRSGHVRGDQQPDHALETPLAKAFLDGLEQVLGFQFLDRHIRVAGDVERMRFQDLHAGKQHAEVRGDHLLQPHQVDPPGPAALGGGLRARAHRHQLGQRIGHFDAREVLVAGAVANRDRQVQAEIRDVGKGPAGIEGQRGQHGKHGFVEVPGRLLAVGLVQLGIVVNENALFAKRLEQAIQGAMGLRQQPLHLAPDGHQLRPRAHAVRARFERTRLQLRRQARHPHHEKLVQVGAENRQELHPLQQRVGFILGLFEHAALEREQAQLAVHVERRVFQVHRRRRCGSGLLWGAGPSGFGLHLLGHGGGCRACSRLY